LTKKDERLLTKKLGEKLQPKFKKVYTNRNPARSGSIREFWQQLYKGVWPPIQPEMDLIFLDKNDSMKAAELKYFKQTKKGRLNHPFYVGIEQALALLRWGFDSVALWQLFDESIPMDALRDYGCRTWQFIHSYLNLPIDFTVLRVVEGTDETRFQVIQADWSNNLTPIELRDIDDPNFHITWRRLNPLNVLREVRLLGEKLKHWLMKNSNVA
jgi:hypothetical protein